MKELYELKDLVCDELKEYGKKGEISMGNLDVIDKLSHTLKSLETIIAMNEANGGNSEYYPMGSYRGSYNDGGNYSGRSSYARGRMNARRDSMGRYSRDDQMDNMVDQLRGLMDDAPNDRVRSELQKVVTKMEQM